MLRLQYVIRLCIFGLPIVWLAAGASWIWGMSSVEVKDSLGRSVKIKLPVRRIVVLNTDALEVLRALKAEEMVVGVVSEIVRNRSFWGELAKRPEVGSWNEPDLEAIVSLGADLIVAYGKIPGEFLERKLSKFGIQVLRLDLYKLDRLEHEVFVLGKVLNRSKEARTFCDWFRNCLELIQQRIKNVRRRPKVYVESYTDYHAAGPGSGGDQMCSAAGGWNVASIFSVPYPRVTPEWVLAQNPEVIIKAVSYDDAYSLKNADPFNRRRDALMNRPAWRGIAAVAMGNVHVVESAIWTGPAAVVGVAYMASWIHPDLFHDLDPERLHREYMDRFQRIPYRGKFVSDDIRRSR